MESGVVKDFRDGFPRYILRVSVEHGEFFIREPRFLGETGGNARVCIERRRTQ